MALQDRLVVDAVAIVQALNQEAAAFQAKALGQRALVDAAKSRQLGLVAADADKLCGVYEDVVARLYSIIDNVVAAKGPSTGRVQDVTTSPLQSFCDKVSPKASSLCRRCEEGAQKTPQQRYGDFGLLVTELSAMTKPFPPDVTTALQKLYDVVVDKLPDLDEVSKALAKCRDDWKAETKTSSDSTSLDPEAVKRSDFFKKLLGHVAALKGLRLQATQLDPHLPTIPALLDSYEKLCDLVVANLQTQSWPAGTIQATVGAVVVELRRLRSDCVVVVAMSRLRG